MGTGLAAAVAAGSIYLNIGATIDADYKVGPASKWWQYDVGAGIVVIFVL